MLRQQERPFTFVIDLSRGALSQRLTSIANVPTWKTLSIGRIREANQIALPTSGHLLSHSVDEMRAVLEKADVSEVLVLDDTSFSGVTSLLLEDLMRKAFPERKMKFTHGFLILNKGLLGPQPGAKHQIEKSGSSVLAGMEMVTPIDDGWHFFDMVQPQAAADHFLALKEFLELMNQSGFENLAALALSDESMLQALFPQLIATDVIRDLQQSGHFIARGPLRGDFHVRNPQLLPNIIGQDHVLEPKHWRGAMTFVLSQLMLLNFMLKEGKNETEN